MEDDSTLMWKKNDVNIFCNIVPAGFMNLLPAGTKVTITHIKAKFNYSDGTSDTVERSVYILPQGGDEVLMSSCTDKCVKSVVGTMTILDEQGGGSRTVVLEKTRFADGGPNKCITIVKYPLGLNTSVDAEVLEEFRKTGDSSIFISIE